MTGDKPDPRLRTPMQWAGSTGVGFTTGTPWESPQPDSLTVNVAAQDGDPGSLLTLYRRLIHLRASNDALARGELVALQTSDPHVAAYLRRTPDSAVLVVANVGSLAASALSISSGAGALAEGEYEVSELMGERSFVPLRADREGRIAGYAPLTTALAPHATLVLDLVRRKE